MLTKAQRREIERAVGVTATDRRPGGVINGPVSQTSTGFARRSWEKMMDRACHTGHFRRYVHGGYEITDLGRSEAASLRK